MQNVWMKLPIILLKIQRVIKIFIACRKFLILNPFYNLFSQNGLVFFSLTIDWFPKSVFSNMKYPKFAYKQLEILNISSKYMSVWLMSTYDVTFRGCNSINQSKWFDHFSFMLFQNRNKCYNWCGVICDFLLVTFE